MKVRDKKVKEWVDVSDGDCPKRPCYWPRSDPGTFTQGVGYRSREGKVGWLCGRREINGCPHPKPDVVQQGNAVRKPKPIPTAMPGIQEGWKDKE